MLISLAICVATFVVIVVLILLYASTKPDIYHVERSIQIQASPEAIFPLVNDLHQWERWTPYNKDPAMQKTYSGSGSGPGAHYAWSGNKQVGQGEISIRSVAPPSQLVFDLHMIKPFQGRNVATFSLDAEGAGTRVTWSLDDRHTLLLKVISLFLNLDKMIGKDFEAGLAKLKTVSES